MDNEILLFILIIFSVAVVVLGVLIFVFASIIKSVKGLFKRKDEVLVSEIIEEKQQGLKKNYANAPAFNYGNIKIKKADELKKDQKQTFDEKEKKDIEEGLDALKKSARGEKIEEDSIFSKIKIPRSKRIEK